MKKLLLCISLALTIVSGMLNAGQANIPQGEPSLQLPPLSEDQWQAFSELLNNMSEEELEFYAKLGEEYINEELKQGRDPYAIFNQLAENPLPEEHPLPLPEQPKKEEAPVVSDVKRRRGRHIFKKY